LGFDLSAEVEVKVEEWIPLGAGAVLPK